MVTGGQHEDADIASDKRIEKQENPGGRRRHVQPPQEPPDGGESAKYPDEAVNVEHRCRHLQKGGAGPVKQEGDQLADFSQTNSA